MKHAWLTATRLNDAVLVTAAIDGREILIRRTPEEAKAFAELVRRCAEEAA